MILDEDRLTICSASFGHAPHLAYNWELCDRLLSDGRAGIDWLIAENAPADSVGRVETTPAGVTVLPGSSIRSLGASYHHADAINSLLYRVATRFVLVLDPDFYILRRNWMSEIIEHMRRRKLAFFGVPWHPRYVENYRYFPAVHCMFIDQSEVPVRSLDFRPILRESDRKDLVVSARGSRLNTEAVWRMLGLGHRLRQPWDTGSRIYLRFSSDPGVRSECNTPVYRLPEEWTAVVRHHGLKSRLLERILPERLCYLPKRRDSYTTKGFKERGWIDLDVPRVWEEHVWKEAPFGLHMRRSFSSVDRDIVSELRLCREVVDRLTSGSQSNTKHVAISSARRNS